MNSIFAILYSSTIIQSQIKSKTTNSRSMTFWLVLSGAVFDLMNLKK